MRVEMSDAQVNDTEPWLTEFVLAAELGPCVVCGMPPERTKGAVVIGEASTSEGVVRGDTYCTGCLPPSLSHHAA